MSYQIVYDKNFIKVEQKNKETVYCPMIYAGSNNCYETNFNGRERRARSWFPHTYIANGKLLATQEEMLAKTEEERQNLIERHKGSDDEYKDSSFGYFTGLSIGGGGCTATFGQYQGIVKTGCRKALTVEQCIENSIRVSVRTSWDFDGELEEKGGSRSINVKTTEEFLQAIEELQEYVKGTKISVTVEIHASENTMKWMRKRLFPKTKKEKVRTEVNHYFAIQNGDNGYYKKGQKNGYRYSFSPDFAKQFVTEKEAQRFTDRLNKRYNNRFSVEKIDEKTVLYL